MRQSSLLVRLVLATLVPSMLPACALAAGDAPAPEATAVPVGTPQGAAIPQLAPADVAAASSIVSSDPTLQRILGPLSYGVSGAVAWTDRELDQVGAVLDLTLAEPLSGSFDWLLVQFDGERQSAGAYAIVVCRYAVDDVHVIRVRVDLGEGRIVGVQPVTDVGGRPLAPGSRECES
jgi:hypothetical protein